MKTDRPSDAIEEIIRKLKKHFRSGLTDLKAFLENHPEYRWELIRSLNQNLSKPLIRRLIRSVPDLVDSLNFEELLYHAPRFLPFWLQNHTLHEHDAIRLFQIAPDSVPSRVYRKAMQNLPPRLQERLSTFEGISWHRLRPWLPALVDESWEDRLTPVLHRWLKGEPFPDEQALQSIKKWLDAPNGQQRLNALPALIQIQINPNVKKLPSVEEILWVIHQQNLTLPETWSTQIAEAVHRNLNPILQWLIRHHPQFKSMVRERAGKITKLPRWTDLKEFLHWLNLPDSRKDIIRMQALLMELGIGIRRIRKHVQASTADLLAVLETTTPEHIKRRFHRLRHISDLPDEKLLPLLIKRRVVRRTVHPKVIEYIHSPKRTQKIIRRIEQEIQQTREKRRTELQQLIQKNLTKPEPRPFQPDPFQIQAVEAFRQGLDVLVTAPTGSGKTWIALEAMNDVLKQGGRAFYSTPLRALSYQKLRSFRAHYGHDQVGVLTGEYRENTDAPILVGTTEIVRNLLLDGVFFDLLVMDEAHYLGDIERGSAWEEAILLTPQQTRLILLSATIPNDEEIRQWLTSLGREVIISKRKSRPVPLVYLTWTEEGPELGLHPHGTRPSLPELLNRLRELHMTPALVFVGRRDDAMVLAREAIRYLPPKPHLKNDLPDHPLVRLLLHGVGAHHAGLSYAFRAAVENLLEKGELEAVFCTSSLAHGIDAPVRTTVLYDVSPFWERSHLQHALGRAGRRGFDQVGFAVVALPPWNIRKIVRALRLGSEPLRSAFAPHDASVAGLINRYGIEGAVELARKSLKTFQGDKRVPDYIVQTMQRLIHLRFMERDGSLTEKGRKLVRLMHPNGAAIVLVLESVTRLTAEDAAMIAAFFCNERPPKRIRKYLRHPLVDLMTRITRQVEVETDPRDGARRAWIIVQWLKGREDELRRMVGVEAEGDLERFRIQVIELLRKLENLELPAATEALSYLDPYFEMEHPDWKRRGNQDNDIQGT